MSDVIAEDPDYPHICVVANRIVNEANEWVMARHAHPSSLPPVPEPYDQDAPQNRETWKSDRFWRIRLVWQLLTKRV